ncbi:hypothetical protein HZY86_08340 [Aerococcaceae bacterium DSM 111020]|nr:hypothetical protein [Aerococcaceae bacterium DSM 111020]
MKDVTNSTTKRKSSGKKHNIRWLYIPTLIGLAIYYYIVLPPIHYASPAFWMFLLIITAVILLIELMADGFDVVTQLTENKQPAWSFNFKNLKIKGSKYAWMIGAWLILALVAGVSYLIFSPLFFADNYSEMIQVERKDFAEDFPETDLSQITLVDRDTAQRLGDRQLGALTDLVSQFEAADDYTQINIESVPYRVSPLEYAGFFKWLNNFRQGIPHYIKVHNVTGEVTLETPPQTIKYSDADLFHRDVLRRLRFEYPFSIFEQPSFEIDDEGNPYYIATTYTRNFFLREPEPSGVILLNAMTGETEDYDLDHIPDWVDRVYSADLILHQLQMKGHYSGGFWNALFAKNGVTQPTEGYNYLPMDDDLYLYTGITSVVADESNIGFMLVNMRTKDAVMYPLTAAEEFSAMRSAEGSVQETEYTATFPLLINIGGRPLYILTLKDNEGLIKEYALIDAQNYQNVITAPNVQLLMQNYALENPVDETAILEATDLEEIEGRIEEIQAVVADGETVYYFMIDGTVYQADLALNDYLPFVESGDSVIFKATENGEVIELNVKQSN